MANSSHANKDLRHRIYGKLEASVRGAFILTTSPCSQ